MSEAFTTELDVSAVWEFRPLPNALNAPLRRFADGRWIEDDGEYDLAFINEGFGPPICLYVELPYYSNIIGKWTTGHWSEIIHAHPHGNAWHHVTADGTTLWGIGVDRDHKPNHRAGQLGMNELCKERSCANGRHVEMSAIRDPHVAAGLVRRRDDQRIYRFPDGMTCAYCGEVAPVGEKERP